MHISCIHNMYICIKQLGYTYVHTYMLCLLAAFLAVAFVRTILLIPILFNCIIVIMYLCVNYVFIFYL